jgi:hypothetical protein
MKYSTLDKINLFFRTYIRMFGRIVHFSAWASFFYLALLQLGGLFLLLGITIPGWKSLIHPILSLFLPAPAFHFPRYLLAIPGFYTAFDNYLLGPTGWVILSGAAVYVLGGQYFGDKPRFGDGFKRALHAYFPLLLVWLIEMILVIVVFKIAAFLFVDLAYGSPRLLLAIRVGLQLAAFLPSAFLIYAIPGIILDKRPVFKAIGNSFSLCSHSLFLTYSIILFPGLIRLVFDILIQDYSYKIVATFNPDIVVIIIILKIIVGIFINLFILGSATYLYRDLTR